MKRLLFAFFLSVLFFSCVPEDHVLEVEVINNTTERVQNIEVLTADGRYSFTADNLPPGQKIDHTLQVPENFADGNFTFRFTRGTGEQETTTGSYLEEEPGPLKKTLVFDIQDQGVNVEQKVLEVE